MVEHVRTTIRYDGPALSGHEMDVRDLAPALLALADIVQIANRKFNGNEAEIRVLVNADVEQRCFQIDLSLVQSVLEKAKHFLADDHLKTALEIAKDIGLVGGSGLSLLKLLSWISKRPKSDGTTITVKTEGGVTTLVTGDGNSISVSNHVYQLASDPNIIADYKKLIEPLSKPGYESLELKQGEDTISKIGKEDAELGALLNETVLDTSREDISIIRGHVRIKSPQYEGNAKWSVLWGGKAIDATMEPTFVKAFQENEVQAPPHTVLDVAMEQRVALDDSGKAIGSPTYTVIEIHQVILPPPPTRQIDWIRDN